MKPVIVLLVCCLHLVTGQRPHFTSCNPDVTNPGPPFPQLPTAVVAGIEVFDVIDEPTNRKGDSQVSTANLELFYDFAGNRAAVQTWTNGTKTSDVYNFDIAQMFHMSPVIPSCQTVNLTEAYQEQTTVPYTVDPDGRTHISPLSAVLGLDPGVPVTYNGTGTKRAVPVNHWYACMHDEAQNATYQLDLYFTAPGFPTVSGLDQVPVLVDASGKGFYRRLNIFQWRLLDPQADRTRFHVGDFCPGRISTKAVPGIPERFSMQAEEMLPNQADTSLQTRWIREFYDYPGKLFRVDDQERDGASGKLYDRRILDFNVGLQYMMDTRSGNCSIIPIPMKTTLSGPWHPADMYDPSTVGMKTPSALFRFDEEPFTYQGEGIVRDVYTDVWGSRDLRSSQTERELWMWHFTKDNLTSPGSNGFLSNPVPVALAIYTRDSSENELNQHFYHIFDFNTRPFSYRVFDVSMCFDQPDMKQSVYIKMETQHKDLVTANQQQVLGSVQRGVCDVIDLAVNRVSDVQIQEDSAGDFVWVGITMLERVNVTGNSVDARPQKPLQTLIRDLKTHVQENRLKIEINIGGQLVQLQGVPGQVLTEQELAATAGVQIREIGVRTGTIAGIVVGVLVLGLLLGVAAVHIRKRVTSSERYRTVSMQVIGSPAQS